METEFKLSNRCRGHTCNALWWVLQLHSFLSCLGHFQRTQQIQRCLMEFHDLAKTDIAFARQVVLSHFQLQPKWSREMRMSPCAPPWCRWPILSHIRPCCLSLASICDIWPSLVQRQSSAWWPEATLAPTPCTKSLSMYLKEGLEWQYIWNRNLVNIHSKNLLVMKYLPVNDSWTRNFHDHMISIDEVTSGTLCQDDAGCVVRGDVLVSIFGRILR